jgi:hypothetical protein
MHANAIEFGKAVVECIGVVGVHLLYCHWLLTDAHSGARVHLSTSILLLLA